MRNTVFSLLMFTALTSCSQKEVAHSKQTAATVSKNDIHITDLGPVVNKNKFPLIHLTNNKNIEDKINTVLQLEELEHLPGIFKKNPFEKVTYGNDEGGASLDFDGYQSNPTISNVLSLTLSGESMGAYPEDFQFYYNFDLRTGNKIMMQQLFTEDGLNNLTQSLNQHVKKTIDDYLVKLQQPGSAESANTEDSTALDDEEGMYEECLGNVMDYKAEYYTFFFSHDSITFERERCSNHAMRALDELEKFHITIAFKDLKQYLSPYGESLLNGSMDNIQSSSPEGRLYKGFINGKYPIHAFIPTFYEDGSLSVMYWYDKTKIPIEWTGDFKNNHFTMKEYSTGQNESGIVAVIDADWNDNKITGTWTNNKTKEMMKLELVAY